MHKFYKPEQTHKLKKVDSAKVLRDGIVVITLPAFSTSSENKTLIPFGPGFTTSAQMGHHLASVL